MLTATRLLWRMITVILVVLVNAKLAVQYSECANFKCFNLLEKTESLLPTASDPLGIFIKEGNPTHLLTSWKPNSDRMWHVFSDYATNLSNSSYTKNTGVASSEWSKHIFQSVTLPRPSEDFCRYLCNTSKSSCEVAVLDANKCLMGNLSYTAGNPTLLGSTWNVDIQAGIYRDKVNQIKPSAQPEIFLLQVYS